MGRRDDPPPVDQGAATLNVPHRGQSDPEVDHPGPVELLGVADPLQRWLPPAPAISHGNRMVTSWWSGITFVPLVNTHLL